MQPTNETVRSTPSATMPLPRPGTASLLDLVTQHIRQPHCSGPDLFDRLGAEAPVLALPLNMFLISRASLVRKAAALQQLAIGGVTFPPPVSRAAPDFVDFFTHSLSFLDRAEHHRLRSVLAGHFTPAGVQALRPGLSQVVGDLIREVAARPGRIDLVADFSDKLPMRAMGLLLGVPENEWDALAIAGRGMLALIARSFPRLSSGHAPITNEEFLALAERVRRLLQETVPEHTLAHTLQRRIEACRLTRDEATELMLLLFMTGVDTVAAALTNTVLLLCRHEQARTGWLGGRTSTRHLLDEALRLDTPLTFALRIAVEDVDLDGTWIPAGATVLLCTAAANLDPTRFPEPRRWAPGTRAASLSFGHGSYRCLGAMFALLQCELALEALRPLGVQLTDAVDVRWRRDISFHTPSRLPVLIGRGWPAPGADDSPAAALARAVPA